MGCSGSSGEHDSRQVTQEPPLVSPESKAIADKTRVFCLRKFLLASVKWANIQIAILTTVTQRGTAHFLLLQVTSKYGGALLESVPESLGNLTSLQRLDLQQNRLESVPESLESVPESLCSLTSLQQLTLHQNQELCQLPQHAFSLLASSLHKLHIDSEQASAFPSCWECFSASVLNVIPATYKSSRSKRRLQRKKASKREQKSNKSAGAPSEEQVAAAEQAMLALIAEEEAEASNKAKQATKHKGRKKKTAR